MNFYIFRSEFFAGLLGYQSPWIGEEQHHSNVDLVHIPSDVLEILINHLYDQPVEKLFDELCMQLSFFQTNVFMLR